MEFPESKTQDTSSVNHLIPKWNISSLSLNNEEGTETDPLLPKDGRRFRRTLGEENRSPAVEVPPETLCSLVLQILLPFLLAGLGTVFAGLLLDVVQSWDVFQEVTELLILLPAVLGMKGNLEMTLASRLSTAVNAGKMEVAREKWMLILGNLALKQLQASILGLLASFIAVLLGCIADGSVPFHHMVLLCSTGLWTAFVASLLQGMVMVGVILGSKRLGINPDNVATPMAASFGDLVTLALLAFFSRWFYSLIELYSYALYLLDLFLLFLMPIWTVISSKHPASRLLLRTGWEPIVTAMLISSLGGLILDKTVSDPNLAGIILYAPVINGIGGNLVSIQASRISTNLHMNFSPGDLPENRKKCCHQPCGAFFGSGPNSRCAKVLLLMVVPGQLLFLYLIHLIKGAPSMPSLPFTVAFLSASFVQVFCLLCIADGLVHCLWRRRQDPDSYSIPYLTALGDLLGTALLSLAFLLLWWTGDSGGV
ncbi:solute carrier family 41 member 2 isoform X2 [Stigmatopora nigra]